MSTGPAPDLLAAIVAATRTTVAVRESQCPLAHLANKQVRTPAGEDFERALAGAPRRPEFAAPRPRPVAPAGAPASRRPAEAQERHPDFRIIAECKRRSPSRGILREDYDPAGHARAYAQAGAAAISVLTEPTFFDGRLDHLREVREAVELPILRKDFIVSEYQLVESAVGGADAILLIAGALTDDELRHLLRLAGSMSLAALVEVHDPGELERAVEAGARLIGVNSRNLRTLGVDPSVFDTLAGMIPAGTIAIAESGIRSHSDLERLTARGYDAFLVGERLITERDPGAALRDLKGLSPCG